MPLPWHRWKSARSPDPPRTSDPVQPEQPAQGMLSPAKVIVALDFGTAYSGFSFVHTEFAESHPENLLDGVEGFDRWPAQDRAGARPYFKTLSGLLYMQKRASENATYELKAWGWAASVEYNDLLKRSGNSTQLDGMQFHFITKFKLALAGQNAYGEPYRLPPGFTVERVIADYLRQLSIVIDIELRSKYGASISRKDIQWCLTVPAMWEDSAKQQMKICAQQAGLVFGPSNRHGEASPHPLILVLEPEAASVYGLYYLKKIHKSCLAARTKILIVDAGGGTVDLVLHETVGTGADSNQVKESGSSGGLCGSTLVDDAFHKLLSRKITCYEQYIRENPSARSHIRKEWEEHKITFEGELGCTIWLYAGLSRFWENYNDRNGLPPPADGYDYLEISLEEMVAIFDFAVDRIVILIDEQLNQVRGDSVDTLLVVGGFSGSKYLMNRLEREFGRRVQRIISPPHAGKAVVTGAVAYGCSGREIVVSRVSRKTYGIGVIDDAHPSRALIFDKFVQKGDELSAEHCIKKTYSNSRWRPGERGYIYFDVVSTENRDPRRVNDWGVKKECRFTFMYPVLSMKPSIEVSMFFGRTSVEVSAVGLNFYCERKLVPSITFEAEADFLRR